MIAIGIGLITFVMLMGLFRYMDNRIRHPNELSISCFVCGKQHWVPKIQLASWVLAGMHGEGRCGCGSAFKATYLAHPYTQKVISNAYSQVFRNEAADDTIKTIRSNLDLASKLRLPEVVKQ